MNFTIIRQSSGLCVVASINCELESPATYRNPHRNLNQLDVVNPTIEQILVSKHAEEICNHYRHYARQLIIQLNLPSISQRIEHISMTSCINDLESTGDKRFANSIIQLSLTDTIENFNISEDQKIKYFEKMDYILETVLEKSLRIVDDLKLKSNTNDVLQSYAAPETEISQDTIVFTAEQLTTTTSSCNR
ncbi:unnamed protein product, partial [Rotaria sp. Silwood2]